MNLHLNKELFRDFIDNLNTKTGKRLLCMYNIERIIKKSR